MMIMASGKKVETKVEKPKPKEVAEVSLQTDLSMDYFDLHTNCSSKQLASNIPHV